MNKHEKSESKSQERNEHRSGKEVVEKKEEMAFKMRKNPKGVMEKNNKTMMEIDRHNRSWNGKSYKKEIDNKKPFAKKDSERFEENGGMSSSGVVTRK